MWLSSADRNAILDRLRQLEQNAVADRSTILGHVSGCRDDNADTKSRDEEEARQRVQFRREMRGYIVLLLLSLVGMFTASRFHLW